MAYREIGGRPRYPKPASFKKGELMVEGIFKGEMQGKYGVQFRFLESTGQVVVLNGSGKLKHLLGDVAQDTQCKVIYGGMEIVKSGAMAGKEAHQFFVSVDDGEVVNDEWSGFQPEDETDLPNVADTPDSDYLDGFDGGESDLESGL
jgi:hypothetical protein